MSAGGFLIAAPQSGSGKTTITLGLLRALSRAGHAVRSAKAGPDFIDPAFHAAATGQACVNLDPWAMREDLILSLANRVDGDEAILVVEGMMGLFDGGADGSGSAADLARLLQMPVVLVVDAAKQSHSIAALVSGFLGFRSDISIAGVILNKVGSTRHEAMLREALDQIDVLVLGCVFRNTDLEQPSRHLGLQQAGERIDLETFLEGAADQVEKSVDLESLLKLKRHPVSGNTPSRLAPLGQRIAVADDIAFAFAYPHLLDGWRDQGAEILPFSPLNNEAPDNGCDAVYLPGGYPELHAGKLAQSTGFLDGLQAVRRRSAFIYGECGGFMVLGESLIDADGTRHQMAGLLPLETSFAERRLHLGYRHLQTLTDTPFAKIGDGLTAHEFHYSTLTHRGEAKPLFEARDARGQELGSYGMVLGNVAGSYLHLIDRR
ncbi:MAG: cobyrinate a,c-diamide synthase [Rhizobiaceae bacterium]